MPRRLDHIAIAVKSLADGEDLLNALGLECERRETIPDQGVKVAFFDAGGVHVELMEPTDTDGPVHRFLGNKRAVVHHLAFDSDNVVAEMDSLQAKGIRFTSEEPRAGSRGKRIVFVHPKSAHDLLLELCQAPE